MWPRAAARGARAGAQVSRIPSYRRVANYMYAGTYTLALYGALLLVIDIFHHGAYSWALTNAGFWGCGGVSLLDIGVVHRRRNAFERQGLRVLHKLRQLATSDPAAALSGRAVADALPDFRFGSVQEARANARTTIHLQIPTRNTPVLVRTPQVETVLRVVRRGVNRKARDPEHVAAGEAILMMGLRQFPESAFLHILYGSFLEELCDDASRAVEMLDRARGLQARAAAGGAVWPRSVCRTRPLRRV